MSVKAQIPLFVSRHDTSKSIAVSGQIYLYM